MKLVFALYKYFPFGGLQKDMLAIARECRSRDHQVSIYCQSWAGDIPGDGIEINILPAKAFSNHGKNSNFAIQLMSHMKRARPDMLVAFNKIPDADIYYAADTCFKAKLYRERPWFYRFLPRYHYFVKDEEQLFNPLAHTFVLALSQPAIDEYQELYQTPSERFSLLPPGVSRDRINTNAERLYLLHDELRLEHDKKIVLMIGSGFRTKGLDRTINAMAALPIEIKNITHLIVAGEDNNKTFVEQAKQHGIEQKIHFIGGRKDIPQLLRSADVLLHPAYRENTGTVLLEAAVAGLPVITTDVCGYAHYIADNQLGMVLSSPFQQHQLNNALLTALTDATKNQQWRSNGIRFAQTADIYNMPQRAVDVVESIAKQRGLL